MPWCHRVAPDDILFQLQPWNVILDWEESQGHTPRWELEGPGSHLAPEGKVEKFPGLLGQYGIPFNKSKITEIHCKCIFMSFLFMVSWICWVCYSEVKHFQWTIKVIWDCTHLVLLHHTMGYRKSFKERRKHQCVHLCVCVKSLNNYLLTSYKWLYM